MTATITPLPEHMQETSPGSAPQAARDTRTPLIEIRGLKKSFPIKGGIMRRTVAEVRAVDGVDLRIYRGETLGLVGESGCGKTTVGRLLLRLIDPTAGQILFEGKDISKLGRKALRPYRRRMQIIFQDPYSSLDPRTPVGDSIGEGLRIHHIGNGKERRDRVAKMMDMVGLQPYHARRYPHEFSGGQRQRIGIARALVLEPDLLVCDEPVSALDVSIQAQVLNLLRSLQRELGLTYLFVAHNMGVVEHIADRVAVMYLGRVAEIADGEPIYRDPWHPYTQALMSAIPLPDPTLKRKRIILPGDVPSPVNPPAGCNFHPRCWLRSRLDTPAECSEKIPELRELQPRHIVGCHFAEKSTAALNAPSPQDARASGAATELQDPRVPVAISAVMANVSLSSGPPAVAGTGPDGPAKAAADLFKDLHQAYPQSPILHYAWAASLQVASQSDLGATILAACVESHPGFWLAGATQKQGALAGWNPFFLPEFDRRAGSLVHPLIQETVTTSALLVTRQGLMPHAVIFLRDAADELTISTLSSRQIELITTISSVTDPQVVAIDGKIEDAPAEPFRFEILQCPVRPFGDRDRLPCELLARQPTLDIAVLDATGRVKYIRNITPSAHMKPANTALARLLDTTEGPELSAEEVLDAFKRHQATSDPATIAY